MTIARHFLVSGRVQGVFYRSSTQAKARELGLTGWVHNLPDGRVEAMACGEPGVLEEFERWLWRGPERASVTGVEVQPASPEQPQGFEVR
jgi:acylphosphatase